jgi:hypothetical protein
MLENDKWKVTEKYTHVEQVKSVNQQSLSVTGMSSPVCFFAELQRIYHQSFCLREEFTGDAYLTALSEYLYLRDR